MARHLVELLDDVLDELLEGATAAEAVASGLYPFLDKIPEYSPDVSAVISELFGISSALRELATSRESRMLLSHTNPVVGDLELSLDSLCITLDCIDHQFERLGITPDPQAPAFARVWREIQLALRDGSFTFLDRLRTFRLFFLGLADQLKGLRPAHDMRLFREQILDVVRVRQVQDVSLDDAMGNLSLGYAGGLAPRLARRSSFRISLPRPVQRPAFLDDEHYSLPPETPEPPSRSPVTTLSSTSSDSRQHWALTVFDGRHPVTPFSSRGSPSRCMGRHMDDAEHILSRSCQKLLDLELDNGAIIVQFYLRPRDHRATILCMSGYQRRGVADLQSWASVSSLGVSREGSSLHLYQMGYSSRSRQRRLSWAIVRFRSYERMVLFFCTFLALRAQGPAEGTMKSIEHQLDEEVPVAEYQVHDDGFLHALRIFRDRDSGGSRLEAAALTGELKDMPVWTAFITEHVGSRSWVRRIPPRNVHIQGLHLYIFSHDYAPSSRRQGSFELSFETSEDAVHFVETCRSSLRPR